ncbi:collectin-10-like [Branchiostoma lanceolatum]|uniref:collectin-10-like n=1 Tax=Branchiostoma lanceolatum TaxID=7740 RepID=UPI003451587A
MESWGQLALGLPDLLDLREKKEPWGQLDLRENGVHRGSCPERYAMWRGICYKGFKIPLNFHDATETCRKDGGTLAMPRDAESNAFLSSLKQPFFAHLIGLHQREEGKFEWIDGSPLEKYTLWHPSQPE